MSNTFSRRHFLQYGMAAIAMYKSTCAYCKWEDQGIVTISGMTERDSMASSPKLEEVRELARKLA